MFFSDANPRKMSRVFFYMIKDQYTVTCIVFYSFSCLSVFLPVCPPVRTISSGKICVPLTHLVHQECCHSCSKGNLLTIFYSGKAVTCLKN